MEDLVGSDLETIRMVGLNGRKAHLVNGIYMPTSQRSFSMPVYYRLEDEEDGRPVSVTMTKLSITQIERHSYGWTVQDSDLEILAKAVYPKEALTTEEPFGLPQQMEASSWKLLGAVGSFDKQPQAHFEVCQSPFSTMQQMKENADAAGATTASTLKDSSRSVTDSDDDTTELDDEFNHLLPLDHGGLEDTPESMQELERHSEVISEKWSLRLGALTATQGTMSAEVDAKGEVSLRVRPTWPDWLKDASFEVVKTNRFGNRQRRQLRLTKHHILNVKAGKEVSRLHPYSQISRVFLTKSNRFVVEFNEGEDCSPLEYRSDDAWQIVQQIRTRIQVRAELQRLSPEALLAQSATWRDSSSKERKPVPSSPASSTEKLSRDSNVLDFSKSLGLLAKHLCESQSIAVTPSKAGQPQLGSADAACLRAVNIAPGSSEFLVKKAVEAVVLSRESSAGATRLRFIEKFKSCESQPGGESDVLQELRRFIDGMHGYVLQHNLPQLAATLKLGTEQRASATTAITEISEDSLMSLSYIVFTVVEASMFNPLYKSICSHYFSASSKRAQERDMCHRIKVLSQRRQQDWDIAPAHVSPAGWSSAIFELAGVERNPTQSMRLQALVYAAKAIYAEFKCEVLPLIRAAKGEALSSSDAILGADDFLPIFIFVVCQAQLAHPHLNKDLLWTLCHPDQLRGESGYYLTMYEAALEFIMGVELPLPCAGDTPGSQETDQDGVAPEAS